MIAALIIGTVLALAALAFVLSPVVFGVKRRSTLRVVARSRQATDTPIAALREIEFDRATGKLSDADYAALRGRYAAEALASMRSQPARAEPVADDPIEAAVRAYRSEHAVCAKCGIRPEADPIYCSNCGEYLPGKCDGCGVAVTAAGVRFCIDCGRRLAA